MDNLFVLSSTYEMLLDFKNTTHPVRIEVFHDVENPDLFRARVWELSIYNLHPTHSNIDDSGGLKYEVASCDEMNREITTVIAEDQALITGKVYADEKKFVRYVTTLVNAYFSEIAD